MLSLSSMIDCSNEALKSCFLKNKNEKSSLDLIRTIIFYLLYSYFWSPDNGL